MMTSREMPNLREMKTRQARRISESIAARVRCSGVG
jgi:hypothetical protein